jgi:hypothetical protein
VSILIMYHEGSGNADESVRQFLDEGRDYNHHTSASLEVEDAGAPANNLEEEIQTGYDARDREENASGEDGDGMDRQNISPEYNYMQNQYQNQYPQHQGLTQHDLHMQQQALAQEQLMQYHAAQQYQQSMQQHMMYDQMGAMHQGTGNQMPQHSNYAHSAAQQAMHHSQLRGPPSNGGSEDQQPPAVAARKKTRTQYPWLEVSGPACLSERQEARLPELSNVSKKYKSMRCLYCMKYNPITPWATMRPRKYEMSSLQDHANSAHHLKSEKLRAEALNFPAMVPSVVFQIQDDPMAPASAPPTTEPQHVSAVPAVLAAVAPLQAQAPVASAPAAVHAPIAVQSAPSPVSSMHKPVNKNKRSLMEMTKTHATRGALRPAWLHTEGGLIFSDRQLNDPDRPASLVRKYQMMMCTLCAAHSPRSPWAALKPRKFEARLLAEHELSTHHQKSLNSAAYPPMAQSLPIPPSVAAQQAGAHLHAANQHQHPQQGQSQGQGQGHPAHLAQQPHGGQHGTSGPALHTNASAAMPGQGEARYAQQQPTHATPQAHQHALLQHGAAHMSAAMAHSAHAQHAQQTVAQQMPLHMQQMMLQQQLQRQHSQQQQLLAQQHALQHAQQLPAHLAPHLAHLPVGQAIAHGGSGFHPTMAYAHSAAAPQHLLPEHAQHLAHSALASQQPMDRGQYFAPQPHPGYPMSAEHSGHAAAYQHAQQYMNHPLMQAQHQQHAPQQHHAQQMYANYAPQAPHPGQQMNPQQQAQQAQQQRASQHLPPQNPQLQARPSEPSAGYTVGPESYQSRPHESQQYAPALTQAQQQRALQDGAGEGEAFDSPLSRASSDSSVSSAGSQE